MELNSNDAVTDLIKKMLEDYTDRRDGASLQSYLETEIQKAEQNALVTSAEQKVREIADTIDTLAMKMKDLKEFKKTGRSREAWLGRELSTVLAGIDPAERLAIMKTISDAMKKANSDVTKM